MNLKICCASSAGGHLKELLMLEEAFRNTGHFFLTDKRLDSEELAKKEKTYFVACPRRNPAKLLLNFVQSFRVFLKEKPDAVISTGADTAVPICLIAKLFGKKLCSLKVFAE